MSSQASMTDRRTKFPPIGVLILCIAYVALASRELIRIVPGIGKINTSWPHHGVFHQWDFLWQILFVLIYVSVLLTSIVSAAGNRIARLLLLISLLTFVGVGYIQSAHHIFLQYKFQSSDPLPSRAYQSVFWQPVSEVGYWWLVLAFVLMAHYWLFFRVSSAKMFFSAGREA